MRKKLVAVLVFSVLSCILTHTSRAGLINYERRNRLLRQDMSGDLPAWMKEMPDVTNDYEKRYDINMDGKLQTSEVKILLRDVIKLVQEKGGLLYESDILKEYDLDKNSIINAYELDKIKKDVDR